MKIVHLSYAYIPSFDDPYQWLKRLSFFTGIVSKMAATNEVISVHHINYNGIIEYEGAQFHFLKARVWQNLLPLRTNRYVKKLKPDTVIVHGFHFLWSVLWLRICIGRKVKILVQHHAEKPFTGPKKYLQQAIDRFIAGYFFTSLELASDWVNSKLIKNKDKLYEVMEASSAFYPMDKSVARQRTGIENTKVYLWVGRFDSNKDPLTLVKAFTQFAAEVPTAKLYIVFTQADLLDEVNELVKANTNIILVGSIAHEELLYWFNSADFIISTSHYEGSGIAVCEGMSCGCIPIVSDIPSFRMMTHHGECGLLFTPGDYLQLESALNKSYSLSIPEERNKVLRQFESELSFEAIAEKMLNKIGSLNRLKKKIAIIIPGGIGTGRNNIGVPVLERIVKLLALDFEIVVFSLFTVNTNYKAEGFEMISIPGKNFISRSWNLLSAFRKRNKQKFDIVHGFWTLPSGLLAVLIGKFFKIKSIVSILGGDAAALPEINYGQLRKKFSRKIVFLTLGHADEVISLTQYLVDNLAKAGFQKRYIHVIPWGIDTSLFRYKTKAFEIPIQFLHIANLNKVKDQMTLLRAFKIISSEMECHLTMVGEGPLEKNIKGLVTDLRLTEKITFKDLMPYENLPEVYQQAHILLHTSLSEGQSEVVTEAMSAGVVVCGTRVGLLYDLPQACVSVDVKDYQGLATEVLLLMKDKSRIENLQQLAHSWASEHSISWTVSKIGKLYRE